MIIFVFEFCIRRGLKLFTVSCPFVFVIKGGGICQDGSLFFSMMSESIENNISSLNPQVSRASHLERFGDFFIPIIL